LHISFFSINLEEERARTYQLQEDLRKKESTIKNLQAMLNDEKQRMKDAKLKDAALIEVRFAYTHSSVIM
jgi:cell division protein FtsL